MAAAAAAVTVLVAALLTALGMGSASAETTCHPYPDVTAANPACANIAWLKGQAITKPTDGLYHPRSSVTRGSMTAFLFRLVNPGKSQPACSNRPFPDVATTSTFCGYITWAKKTHIAFGYSNGTYGPANPVTRGAMAAYLFRIANPGHGAKTCTSKPFADVGITDTFCGVITWMRDNGITYGVGDGTDYGTADLVTRQAMASFLHRTYLLIHGGSAPTAPTTSTPPTTTSGGARVTTVDRPVTIDGIIYSGVTITITLVQIVDPVTSPDWTPDPGNKFVGLEFRIKSVGSTTYTDYAPFDDLVVTDNQFHQYNGAGEIDHINAGPMLPSVNVPVGSTVDGYLVVEMPKDNTISSVSYTLDLGAGGTAIWTL
jgi:hypothetical protein